MIPPISNGKSDPKGFGKVAIKAGIVAFIIAVCWFLHSCYLIVSSFRTPGQITQVIDQPIHKQDMYFPVFTYTDQTGTQHTIHSNSGSSNWTAYHVGDQITVLYSASDEENPWIDDWLTLWGVPLILIGTGVIFVPVGILAIRSA